MVKKAAIQNVVRMEDILGEASAPKQTIVQKKRPKSEQTDVIKGQPKSGRFWKSEKKKFSSIVKTRGLKSSLEKKQALREKLQQIKQISKERKAKKQEEIELKKQRRRDNLKRQEENRKRSEVVQVITNTKKLKKMKKKHLRNIEKRDTTVVSK